MNGIINVLKPPGMTSNQVVGDIRRICQIKKVGHTGTLDPGAAGVLPICIGKATRLFDYLVDKTKEYICEITFGQTTDTLDSYGQLIAEDKDVAISKANFMEILPRFLSEQTQCPPMYSALKVNGQKMYDLARAGKTIDRTTKARTICIDEMECLEPTGENRFLFRVICSRGTYIRVLCEDMAAALNTCAYMSFLVRSRSGKFSIERAWSLDEIAKAAQEERLHDCIWPMQEALSEYPMYTVEEGLYAKLKNGVPLRIKRPAAIGERDIVCIWCRQELFGLGRWEQDTLKICTYLHDE